MIVYRLSLTKYAKDLNGTGARINGGRWNQKGVACLYTSASRALCVLELAVNMGVDDIPRALSMLTLEIPDEYLHIPIAKLPGDWQQTPVPPSTQKMGTRWLQKFNDAVLAVPSVVVREEMNFLINPLRTPEGLPRILDISDFVFDIRLKV